MTSSQGCAVTVLLVEDDPGDELITREAFEHNKIKNTLPKYDGRHLLERIKSDPDLCHIPVVVLTTSSAEEDIAATSCTPMPMSPNPLTLTSS